MRIGGVFVEVGTSSKIPQEGVGRQLNLPLAEAVKISLRSLKIRFWRSIITGAGIFLGIAFLLSVVTSSYITSALDPEDESVVGAAQKWLIVISILVCTIGITNSMLMSVTERYKEIGTMKCLGALNRFVVKMFLLESSFLGLFGSITGALVGCLSMTLLRLMSDGMDVIRLYPWIPVLQWMVYAVVLGLILSVVGAIYPAYQAAKMMPAEAMRVEV